MSARPENDVTRGELSINTYADLLNRLLAEEGESRTEYATVQHYFLSGIMPGPACAAIRKARKARSATVVTTDAFSPTISSPLQEPRL